MREALESLEKALRESTNLCTRKRRPVQGKKTATKILLNRGFSRFCGVPKEAPIRPSNGRINQRFAAGQIWWRERAFS
jgi:hypothetical protein